ncbi:MAG: arginine--tRNA ligase [Planctomycetes bacterium]|nr:arginine--tRNA ligase [Planctomycetota bacterium]
MNLLRTIQNQFRAALVGLVPDVEPYVAMIKPTQDAKHGDYQANCAMSLAKALGKKPRDIAQDIVKRLDLSDLLEPPEIAGPGFINLRLKSTWLAKQVQAIANDDRLGVALQPAKRYVIDYSSPNVAKPLHVGHLRSTIIGDALTRLLRFLGHTVITDNHLGDWGTQFGILLYGYKNLLDNEAYKKDPVRELARVYIEVRKLIGSDDEDNAANSVADACRAETAKLHHGDPENNRLWREFMPHCLAEIHEVYEKLGILTFDHEHGESFYNPLLPGVVESLLQTKTAEPGEGGAIIVRFSDDNVALVRKRDGAFTYTTSDLATIQYRLNEFAPNAVLYVVDFRQSQHFANLFAAARRWGIAAVELTHISFGSVLNRDGRPISTRKGDGSELIDLINKAVEIGLQKYQESYAERKAQGHDVPDLTEAVQRDIAETVGIGAIKYADLCQNRTSDYKFDYDKMLATEGNTATYMQYAYARNRSILRKENIDPMTLRNNPPSVAIDTPPERALAIQLLRLEESLLAAVAEYQPSAVTAYLWDLAKTYSGFFQNCPVLRAESGALKQSRLLLCDLTARVLQKCLNLLGIKTVDRM